MTDSFMENNKIFDRTYNIGMLSTMFFILINVLNAFTVTESNKEVANLGVTGAFRVAIYYFLYAAIWHSLREVLVKALGQIQLQIVLSWLIRLVIISGLFTLAIDVFRQQSLLMLLLLVGIAMLGFFINFMIRIMQLNINEQPLFKNLRYFVISVIVLFIVLIIIELIALQSQNDYRMLGGILFGVPFVFIYLFFKQAKQYFINQEQN